MAPSPAMPDPRPREAPARLSAVRRVTVIVPAFDEAHRIEPTLTRILAFLNRETDAFEVIVVDDGSSDATADLVRNRFDGRVRLASHEHRRGKGAAVRTGVGLATQPWLLYVDADLAVDVTELAALDRHAAQADVVLGSKRVEGSDVHRSGLRRAAGKMGSVLISTFAVRGFRDTQCGFKLLRTEAAREIFRHQRIDGFGFDFEVLLIARRLGLRLVEVPVRGHDPGRGSISPASYAGVLRDLGAVTWNRLAGYYPRTGDR